MACVGNCEGAKRVPGFEDRCHNQLRRAGCPTLSPRRGCQQLSGEGEPAPIDPARPLARAENLTETKLYGGREGTLVLRS